MLSQANTAQPLAIPRTKVESQPVREAAWLYAEGLHEHAGEDDDFEGNRNWAVIILFAALALFPVVGIALLIF